MTTAEQCLRAVLKRHFAPQATVSSTQRLTGRPLAWAVTAE